LSEIKHNIYVIILRADVACRLLLEGKTLAGE